MVMPRPIRLLAGATMALFVFLLYTIMSSSGPLKAPGLEKVDDMIRDPNLDGRFGLILRERRAVL